MEHVEAFVRRTLETQLSFDLSDVGADDTVGIDSMGLLELLLAVENEYGVPVPEELLDDVELETIKQLVEFVVRVLPATAVAEN